MTELSHHESHVLALVRRWQPTTAYFIRKSLERGLASTFSDSPGSVYPAIDRLIKRGFVIADRSRSDGRRAEALTCTQAGDQAVRSWIFRLDPEDMLPEDPWRTRMALAEGLDEEDLIAWLSSLREVAERQLQHLRDRAALTVDDCFGAALEHALLATETRIIWIDRTIAKIVRNQRPVSAAHQYEGQGPP